MKPPVSNEDGSPLAPSDICGYEARVDGGAAMSLTGAVEQGDGRLMFPFAQLHMVTGQHTVEVRTAGKNGLRSAWTAPLSVAQVVLPNPPTLLSAE